MADQPERLERIDMLRGLSSVELAILRERCRGLTSSEIAAALNVTDQTAAMYLGNIYDKLEITYRYEGTSMGRLMAYCPLLDDYDVPAAPLLSDIDPRAQPPPQRPSAHALDLVRSDDAALVAQRGGGGAGRDNRNWLYGLAALAAILLVAILALILYLGDDDDDDEEVAAADATATALAELEAESATEAEEGAPATETPPEAEEPTATPEPTETPEPTATEEPTEAPEPTEEPETPPTETPEPEPTETPAATDTPAPETEPTNTPVPDEPEVPVPQPGEEIFAADWSQGLDDWELSEVWQVENDALVATEPGAGPAISTFEPPESDYAVEAVMTIENLDNCDDLLAGVFARVTTATTDTGEHPAGYIGGVCEGEWRIEAIAEDDDQRDELESGDLDLDIEGEPHSYRLELAGDRLRLFIDDEFVGEATDGRYTDAGQSGIYLIGDTAVEVEEFRVEGLQPE